GDRETGIVDAILTSHEIVCDNGAIGPGQHVIVKCVHLTEGSSHLSDLDKQPAGDCRKCDVPFLKVYAFLAERKKKVRTSIWVDNSLKRGLGLMHLKCRIGIDLVDPSRSEKVANHRDVRIEHFRARCAAINRQCPGRSARALGACWNF